jgi:DNA modification methylase
VTLGPEDKDFQDLVESIRTLGYAEPILINEDGTIIGGHQRYNALIYLGWDEADVVVYPCSKVKEKALNVALNKIDGRWDTIKLVNLLEQINLEGVDFTVTGFTQDELDDLKVDLQVETAIEDEDFDLDGAYDSIKVPVTKRGDIWILGKHRLMCGDSTRQKDIERLMCGEQADLVITDPPYNVNYEGTAGKIQNDNMDDESFYDFLLRFYKAAVSVMRMGAAAYIFHADSKGHLFRDGFIEAGLKLAECLIWEKNSLVLGRQDYHWRHEPILYGWKEGEAHYFVDDRTQDTILCEDKPRESKLHPTMKPIPLVARLMKNSSKPGWNVLDPFGGSGTTIMAAEQLGRTAFSMELDEKFCDVIVRRWEQYTGEKAVLAEDHLEEIRL